MENKNKEVIEKIETLLKEAGLRLEVIPSFEIAVKPIEVVTPEKTDDTNKEPEVSA